MNFLGMGMPELGVIFLVAFLALGPNRSIEMARTVGKMVRNVQKVYQEVISAVNLDDEAPKRTPPASPPVTPSGDSDPKSNHRDTQ